MPINVEFVRKKDLREFVIKETIVVNNIKYRIDNSFSAKHGGNSFVLKAVRDDNRQTCALKFLVYKNSREISTMQTISSTYQGSDYFITIQNYGTAKVLEKTFKNRKDLRSKKNSVNNPSCNIEVIEMPYAELTFREFICTNEITEDTQKYYIYHLAKGLSDLHTIGIKHLDIKPDNILYSEGRLIFADFGLSTNNTTCGITQCPKTWPIPEYIEPCIDYNTQIDAKKTDIFELGCIYFYLLTKKFPIGSYTKLSTLGIDPNLVYIVEKMLEYDHHLRMNDGVELLSKVERYLST